jgi:hypothetical protein
VKRTSAAKWLLTLALLLVAATALAGEVDAAAGPVMPSVFEPKAIGPQAVAAHRIYLAAQRQAHYLLGTLRPWKEDADLLLLTESRSTEHWIRPNTGTIEGLAFLYRFGTYDENVVGRSREKLLEEAILPMMRYVVDTHVTGSRPTSDGKPWGNHWQSAHWTQMIARAAWWTWDDLPEDLRQGVRRVTAHEADRIAAMAPPSQIKRDTKSEENAWNSQIFSVAMLLMPADPRRPVWEKAFQKWVLSSYLRPSDENCQAIIDGRTVAEQFTGANIDDDFTLENHGFVHPDYMTAFGLSLGCEIDYRMSGCKSPEAMTYNVPGIYENLKWFVLPDGGYVYPNGQDWRLFRNADWIRSHLLMACYVGDGDAWSMAMRSLDAVEKMQARSPQGNVYLSEEFFFASTHSDLLRSLALSWLTIHTADPVWDEPVPRLGVRRLEPARIVLNRTPTAVHTFAWGARTMAQCVPFGLDRVVSPHERNGIGYIKLQGARSALPVRIRSVDVQSDDEGYTADLVVDHGDGLITADLQFRSRADGTWIMRERLTANGAVETGQIATGLIGILNNPNWIYESGRRTITFEGEATEVVALTGRTVSGKGARSVDVDSVLQINSDEPLAAHYQGAKASNRARVTDLLLLNWIDAPKTWKPGEVISRWEATVRCTDPHTNPKR